MASGEVTVKLPHHELYEALVNCTNHPSAAINRLQELEECVNLKQREAKWTWDSPVASEYGTLWIPVVHWASLLGKFVLLQWLKSRGADLSVKCSRGGQITNSTALHSSIWFVDHDEMPKIRYTGVRRAEHFGKVMDVLVEDNPNILLETEEPSGDTILHVCCRKMESDEKLIPEFFKVIFEKLENYKVSYKFDANSLLCKQNRRGETFLHILLKTESRSVAFGINETMSRCGTLWLQLCAVKDISGKTPCDIAVQNSALDSLDIFKAVVDMPDKEKIIQMSVKKEVEEIKNNSGSEFSSGKSNEHNKVQQQLKRGPQGSDHTPFCEKNCEAKHNYILLSLNRCKDKLTTDEFIKVIEKYLGSFWGCVRKSRANANLEDPTYSFPIIHWACALGKDEALQRLSELKEFNMLSKACTGETGLHRAVRCLYRGMGEPKNVARINKVTQIFSRILDVLTNSCPEIILEADDCGDTVLHVNAKELHHSNKKFPNKFRFLENCMGEMLKKLASWQKGEARADLAVSVYSATNDREQNFVHILARVPECRSDSVLKLLRMVDVGILQKLLSVEDCMDETPKETAERKNNHALVKLFDDLMSNTQTIASSTTSDQCLVAEYSGAEQVSSEPDSQPNATSVNKDNESVINAVQKDQQTAVEDAKSETTVSSSPLSVQQITTEDMEDSPLQSSRMTVVDFVAQLSSSPNFSDTTSPQYSGTAVHPDNSEEQVDSDEDIQIDNDQSIGSPTEAVTAETKTMTVDSHESYNTPLSSDYCTSQSYSNEGHFMESRSCITSKAFVEEETCGQSVTSSDQTTFTPTSNPNRCDTQTATPTSSLKRKLESMIEKITEREETSEKVKAKIGQLSDDLKREEGKLREQQAQWKGLTKQFEELNVKMERSRKRIKTLQMEKEACENKYSRLEINLNDVTVMVDTVNKKL